ncbi:hypothetical protein CVCC1112_3688 [Paenarthrobacter nicotinovorans]|nr:hypothetical protein ANMWB30_27110 [Arthrobacter sp. MWB30]GAT89029.1 hypothetical protein CVCC1112_3688 [Paenarthrobacter nicotinovorans]
MPLPSQGQTKIFSYGNHGALWTGVPTTGPDPAKAEQKFKPRPDHRNESTK